MAEVGETGKRVWLSQWRVENCQQMCLASMETDIETSVDISKKAGAKQATLLMCVSFPDFLWGCTGVGIVPCQDEDPPDMRNSTVTLTRILCPPFISLIRLAIVLFVPSWGPRGEKFIKDFFHALAALPHIQWALNKYWLINRMDGYDLRKRSCQWNGCRWKRETRLRRGKDWWLGEKQRKQAETSL